MNKYAECLDYRTNKFIKCREEQAEFEVGGKGGRRPETLNTQPETIHPRPQP